tara:strand:- start:1103 stop:1795 length:693 start_codon:yes stop_codon:yes gene_type:complete
MNSNLIEYLKSFILDQRNILFEEKIEERTKYITVVLEDIFQARNISASIRSADCFGIQDVHIIENDNYFNHDSEVSMGAEKWVSLIRHNKRRNNSLETINKLKSEGYQIIATTPHDTDYDLFDLDVSENKLALFFGSEVKGCSIDTLALADKKIKIPMYGFTESFNISVSVSLCLQHLTYKLREEKVSWSMSQQEKDEVMLQWLRNSIKASAEIEKEYLKKVKLNKYLRS